MQLIYQQRDSRDHFRRIFLLCVFRDEELLLEYFMEYYRSLGVTDFIMIDNRSEDGGPAYLKSLADINLRLYRAEGSYKDAVFGTRWVNRLLQAHCSGQYCFTVDVDELFLFDSRKYRTVLDLINDMEASGKNAVPVTLLDMYPKSTNDSYTRGRDFLEHSPYFDDFNETYYEDRGPVYEKFRFKVGGVRQRVFGTGCCITKFPFFKYDFQPLGMATGYHFFASNGKVLFESEKIRLHESPCILLHFKFIKPNLMAFVEKRIGRNEDWEDGLEYKAYRDELGLRSGVLEFYQEGISRKLDGMECLSKFWRP